MLETDATAVILDEHPLWLDGLERILNEVGITVVGRATRPDDALDLLSEHGPMLFVLDTEMNGATPDGLTCLREALARVPELKVIALSGSDDEQRVEAAFAAGAAAYVLKRAQPEDLAAAFRQVFTPSLYLATRRGPAHVPLESDPDDSGLTRRELEILRLVAEGGTNGDVARRLWVTEPTVKFHLANIFRKLNVTNRTQASRWAHAHGLLEMEPGADHPRSAA